MAMRPGTPRTQPSVRPVYENFQAKSEMKEKEEAYFLHIYLPGFVKERIKINFVSYSRIVRVVGERPINGGNRISRFEQTYPVPENCEVGKLQGNFEQGTLIITMPKKSISPVLTPKAEIETTKKKGTTPISPANKSVPEPKPKEVAKEAIPPKSPTTRKEQDLIGDKKRPQNVQEETMLKSTAIASTPKEKRGKPQTGQEKIEPKPTLTMGPSKQIEDKREEEIRQKAISYIETVKKRLHEMDEKKSVPKKEVKEDGKPHESRKPEKYIDHNMILEEKEIKARKVSPKEAKSSALKAPEKEKETIDKAKSKEDEIYTIGKGIKEVVASASEAVTRIGEGKLNDEEKPLVANMGAAILVIVALGAYVSYKFTTSGRA